MNKPGCYRCHWCCVFWSIPERNWWIFGCSRRAKAIRCWPSRYEANLILAEENERLARQELIQNAHRQDLRAEIINPLADLSHIYPASVEIVIAVYGATASMMTKPESSRIQIKLNSRPFFIAPAIGNITVILRLMSCEKYLNLVS